MIGQKFTKPLADYTAYSAAAAWANANGAMIVDQGDYYEVIAIPAPPAPTPDELLSQFDAAVTARLDTFARTPYAADEQPFDSMDKARLASLTTDYKQWGDIANRLYDTTWKAAEALVPDVMDGTLTIDEALEKLPALSWETA